MKQTFIVGIDTEFKDFNDWIAEHDAKVKADERNKIIAKIKVGLGKFKTFDIDTPTEHRELRYYDAKKVLEVLGDILNEE